MPDFPVVSVYLACLLAIVASTRTAEHSCKIGIDHMPASKSVIVTKLPGSSWTVVFVLRMNTVLKHYSQTVFTKTVGILRIYYDWFVLIFFNTSILKHYSQTVFTKTVHILRIYYD